MHVDDPIIETRTHTMLREAVRRVLSLGRMATCIGPAGIGKSFAARLVAEELTTGFDEVLVFTVPRDKSRSVKRFFQKLLFDLQVSGAGRGDPLEVFAGYMMESWPFRGFGPRKAIIFDEAQHLQANIVECLRWAYDLGDPARNFDRDGRAWGLVFLGNEHFLTGGGYEARAAFEALDTRTSKWPLARPAVDELAALAAKLFPDQGELQAAAVRAAEQWGNFRELAQCRDFAASFAEGGPITLAHLQAAIQVVGGR